MFDMVDWVYYGSGCNKTVTSVGTGSKAKICIKMVDFSFYCPNNLFASLLLILVGILFPECCSS